MPVSPTTLATLDPVTRSFYCRVLEILDREGVPFLVGGAFALAHYTGIVRDTKDFDVFLTPEAARRALQVLAAAGHATEMTYPHWLGKSYEGDAFVDFIFSSGNGLATVDQEWFEHAVRGEALGRAVRFCPPEEILWSKGFVMERERFDGADIAHLLRACADRLDWPRLLRRFDRHWPVLLCHLILFRFVYPGEQARIPEAVLQELTGRIASNGDHPVRNEKLCQGTLLSAGQYLIDIERWGYQDVRQPPVGKLTPEQAVWWRQAIQEDQ